MKAIQNYKHIISTNAFGIAEKVKKEKKGNYNRKPKRGRK